VALIGVRAVIEREGGEIAELGGIRKLRQEGERRLGIKIEEGGKHDRGETTWIVPPHGTPVGFVLKIAEVEEGEENIAARFPTEADLEGRDIACQAPEYGNGTGAEIEIGDEAEKC
jgi:hypothetical protein